MISYFHSECTGSPQVEAEEEEWLEEEQSKIINDTMKKEIHENQMKKAMVRNMWTVSKPMLSLGKFENVKNQAWAEGLKFGTHRLSSWGVPFTDLES